ncbi:DUF5683 domain-containing protein [Thermoflavifilum thermophilum]|uniref:DUF5683 domain-containing protein n=1 Tax=Thermoflavifilum thermophilum TaxID=1393122 RepID=A0A1I7NGC7_9BACT|nr:DUF5683 domain-containing protein [Thermoflavifilum thermophilum]SFV33698.1 hypothetical protein SAMN05660895_1784 [Thermoflavifilum thermophilum]
MQRFAGLQVRSRYVCSLVVLGIFTGLLMPRHAKAQQPVATDTVHILTDTLFVRDTLPRKADTTHVSAALSAADTVRIQPDTTPAQLDTTSAQPIHDPRLAALYSAVLPGLGQAYNHKYWKIPIAYAGLGVAAGVFIYNYKQYILFRDAYRLSFTGQKTGDPFVDQYGPQDQKRIRDIYRQYVDYSALAFLGVYVINIVDALVDAHLYYFNVSDNLTLHLQPVIHSGYVGYGLVVNLGGKH